MGRAGFNLINVDVEDVKINYPSMWELMEDLRDMGESNAVLGRYVLRCFA
jgi:NADH dehydrogenase [ubiquinone] 1 alpha subcomplex assembly factor 5